MDFPPLYSKSFDEENLLHSKRSGLTILKNLAVLCISTLLLFTAYDALTMLQSTMNRKGGIGVISQATLYACFCISAILLPKLIINKLGSKRTAVLGMFCYVPYIAYNYYPHWSLMIPSSFIAGIAGPWLWASYGVYLNGISVLYSNHLESKTGETTAKSKLIEKGKTIAVYDKIPKPEYQVSNVTKDSEDKYYEIEGTSTPPSCEYAEVIACNESSGATLDTYKKSKKSHQKIKKDTANEESNLRAENSQITKEKNYQKSNENIFSRYTEENESNILIPSKAIILLASTTATFFGFHGMAHLTSHIWSSLLSYYILKTDIIREEFSNSSCYCGAHFCNVASDCFEYNAGGPSLNTRYFLTTTCVCISLVSILIAAVFLDPLEHEKEFYFSFNNMKATYEILKRKEMLFLVPLSIHSGLTQAFYVGDFNKSYVACAWGTYHVGLVALCYGIVCGISSVLSGWIVRHVGRRPVFTTAAIVNAISLAYLLVWTPHSNSPKMFFFAAGLWGVHVGIIWSQLRALYGVFFKSDEEAAFSAFHMWAALGMCVSFGYSNFFCTFIKIYVMSAVSVLGFTGYFIAEATHCQK
ncbi:UNC93-like protein [Trichonephila clavipes]|nr:UNC93-like protein [Trichonephila clavipes]